MKKFGLVLIILLIIGSFVSAIDVPVGLPALQATNARIMAMGGAFTAVADTADALFYNPAGLAYLPNTDIHVGFSLLADLNSNIVGMDVFDFKDTYTYEVWDLRYDPDADVVYVDSNSGYGGTYDEGEQVVDLENFGFDNSWDGVEEMRGWYGDFIQMVDGISQGFDHISVLPNISFASRNFGVGFLGGVTVSPVHTIPYLPLTKDASYLEYGFEISKKSGIIAGMGFGLGPLSLGANLKLYKEVRTLFGLPSDKYSDFENYVSSLIPDTPLQEALINILIDDAIAVSLDTENHIEMGFGAMYTLGRLTVGAYVDSILGMILDDAGELKDFDFESIIGQAAKTANIGVSFDPSMRKMYGREPFLNLLVSADLKNIGDDEKRFMNIGAEAGLHIGELAQVDFRAGYKQYLTGPLEDIFSSDIIALEQGELSAGVGVKALFVNVAVAAAVPAILVRDVMLFAAADNFPDPETYFTEYGHNFPRIMVSVGLNL
ncbi:MAG: hypothetical protein ISR78_03890 [Spirochaetia bacterium]|nr:hypothetical protein [Spirochaetia bacterium]